MAWKVKEWRVESLEALVGEQALAAARTTRSQAERQARGLLAAAERDARRLTRIGRRETRAAGRELARLERLGDELLAQVQDRRAALRADGRADARAVPAPEPVPVAMGPTSSRRLRRAQLRSSPLAELFGATDRRLAGQRAQAARSGLTPGA